MNQEILHFFLGAWLRRILGWAVVIILWLRDAFIGQSNRLHKPATLKARVLGLNVRTDEEIVLALVF